jgi:hypothetical protein
MVGTAHQRRKRGLDFLYDLESDSERKSSFFTGDDYWARTCKSSDKTFELQLERLAGGRFEFYSIDKRRDISRRRSNFRRIDV